MIRLGLGLHNTSNHWHDAPDVSTACCMTLDASNNGDREDLVSSNRYAWIIFKYLG